MRFLCLLIAVTSCCHAASPDAGTAALRFLEEVRQGNVDLQPGKGTAISEHSDPSKIEVIADRLKRMVYDLGEKQLEIGRVQTDGELAGVLVWTANGYDPNHMRVFPVAMVKESDTWLPAPVPASFENCGVKYRSDLRLRTQALEEWMLKQQVLDLDTLRTSIIQRMRETIAQSIDLKTLAKLSPKSMVERFLDACKQGRTQEILGLMGGLSDPLPENWAQLATSLTQTPTETPWRLLMDADILRANVHWEKDDQDALYSIACLDTTHGIKSHDGLPQIQLVHLNLDRTKDGVWRIQAPDFFWNTHAEEQSVADEALDRPLLDAFVQTLRHQFPPQAIKNEQQAATQLLSALQQNRFPKLLPLLLPHEDLTQALDSILQAAQIYAQASGASDGADTPSPSWLMLLDMESLDQQAAVHCQIFAAHQPDRFQPQTLFLQHTTEGWLWNPRPKAETIAAFADWKRTQQDKWEQEWRKKMLESCPLVKDIPTKEAPPEQPCRELITTWIDALRTGNIRVALEQCARLDTPDSDTLLLRNLGYEINDYMHAQDSPQIVHFLNLQGWSGMGVQMNHNHPATFPFYPIIATPQGPKILLETDLICSTQRGRKFLNRTSLRRIHEYNAQAAASLKQLFETHSSQCLNPTN